MLPIADQREALNAVIPNSQIADCHEKAGPCQMFFWSCDPYNRLPTNGRQI
jgi:hypothetical protein